LEPKVKRQRELILRRKAALEQDRRQLDPEDEEYEVKNAVIDAKVSGLMVEIMDYGGLPKSWVKELTE
jgi:hypothetical protein